MKGKAVIELIDKITGEVVERVESDNLVTNAIRNVFNIPTLGILKNTYDLGGNYNLSYHEGMFGSSLADKMLCGVLCFSDSITSDADHCVPTNAEMDKLVAYAGKRGNADSSNLMRGNWDSVNSVIASTYATFVFNFDTSEGNGTIKSVCLTSMMGGEQAYHGSQMELKKTLCAFADYEEMGSLESAVDIPDQRLCEHMEMITTPTGYSATAGYVTENGKLVLLSLADLTNVRTGIWNFLYKGILGISTRLDRDYTATNYDAAYQYDISGNLVTGYRSFISDHSAVFANITYSAPNTTFEGVIFSGESANPVQFSVVVSNVRAYVPSDGDLQGFAYYNNFIWFRDYTDAYKVYRVNITSGAVDIIMIPYYFKAFSIFDSQILIGCGELNSQQYVYRVSNVDLSLHIFTVNLAGSSETVSGDSVTVSRVSTLPEPFFIAYKGVGSSKKVPSLCFLTAYLGTINNLSTPVTKTSAQSMRITYTLTDQ